LSKPAAGPSIALVWFRRDLRPSDKPASSATLSGHARVVPVYIAT
jgi:deoxyribodipyrimidine photolyase